MSFLLKYQTAEKVNVKYYLEDITEDQEHYQIPLVNHLDEEGLPHNFQYVPCNFLGTETDSEDFETAPQPCTCSGPCQLNSCSCGKTYDFSFSECCLRADFASPNAKPVIECSSLCTCNSNCSNRVTQSGMNYKLQVYKTKNKGFAVQTLEKICKLTYVCEYAGEIIDMNEAKRRFDSQKPDHPNYIFVCREHCSENIIITTIVDPTTSGNIGRFLNHSCSPNLIMIPVRNENMVPKLCFFTLRDIMPLEELCYDYGASNVFQDDSMLQTRTSSQSATLKHCYCESTNCSGYLPFCSDLL